MFYADFMTYLPHCRQNFHHMV